MDASQKWPINIVRFSSQKTAFLLTYPPSLHEIGDHNDDINVLLPNHSPESFSSVFQWSLCPDVGVTFTESVNKVCVDVVTSLFLTNHWHQFYTSMII